MVNQREIRFEKWRDPLLNLVDTEKLDKVDKVEKQDDEDEENNAWSQHQKEFFENTNREHRITTGNTGPAIVGPMGIIPLHEHNCPSKLYNFWIGHTNFNLTEEVVHDMEWVEGVEGLDIFSRYRFRLAVGQSFKSEDVMQAIRRKICGEKLGPKKHAAGANVTDLAFSAKNPRLNQLQSMLERSFKFWAVCIHSDGKIEVAGDETKDGVVVKTNSMKGQTLIFSWK